MEKSNFIFKCAIPNISKFKSHSTNKVIIRGASWLICFTKESIQTQEWLVIYLICTENGKSSNLSRIASARARLMSINNNTPFEDFITPRIFDSTTSAFGIEFIKWSDLTSVANGFVESDAINLNIEVQVIDPSRGSHCNLSFEVLDQDFVENEHATFQLIIHRINALVAVKTPTFILRHLAWSLTIYRNQLDHLGIRLECENNLHKHPCVVEMSTKIISCRKDLEQPRIVCKKRMQFNAVLEIDEVTSWNRLIIRENGFVVNDSAVFQIGIKAGGLNGVVGKHYTTESVATGMLQAGSHSPGKY